MSFQLKSIQIAILAFGNQEKGQMTSSQKKQDSDSKNSDLKSLFKKVK